MAANNNFWDWDHEYFRLDTDLPLAAISQSLWDEWTQSDQPDVHTLLASTPSSQVIQQPQLSVLSLHNEGKTEATCSSCQTQDFSQDSPRCKRRRMLLFPGDEAEVGYFDPGLHGSIRNNCNYDLMSRCHDDIVQQLPQSASASSLWFSGNDEILSSANACPEKWMLKCINEQEGQRQMNILAPLGDAPEKRVTIADSHPSIIRPSTSEGVKKIAPVKPKLATPVAYPFAVLKPSGVEGDVTLNDINKRILMPPTRPIQHPVGDYAKPPSAASTGSGLSGKAVVALTKIHTEGKGTITIMRTKG